MKMKKIMFITFLILAVLTIGAVSAADDVSSDNMTVSDDSDVVASEDDYDPDDHYIEIQEDEEISIDSDNKDDMEEENEIAYISLPEDTTKGSFQILNGADVVARLDIDSIDEDGSAWYIDDTDGLLYGTIYIKDLDMSKINDGDELTFKFFEINADKLVPIESFTTVCTVELTDSYIMLTVIDNEEDDEEDVETEYYDTEIVMDEGWEETDLVTFTVKDGIDGRIVIYLNNTIAFNKTLSELEEDDEDSGEYTITIGDLNINQAGTYTIRDYFYDNDGNILYKYDDEDPEILKLYESQSTIIDDVTIEIISKPTIINGTESFITVDSNANNDDELLVYIDNQSPIIIKLNECRKDEDGNYILGSKELNMPIATGEHNLNITYKGKNTTGKVNLISNIIITIEDDETIYYKYDEGFVFISLEDGEIEETMEGKISLTIMDDTGNVIDTFEEDLDKLLTVDDESEDARVIMTTNLNTELNGIYTVVVRYFDGNEAPTQAEGKVTFKTLTSEDYGASINNNIKDKNNPIITFKDIPLSYTIVVEIDGESVFITESDFEDLFDQEKGVYIINHTKLGKLTDGFHSINVYLNNFPDYTDLASGNIFVDVEENIDPNLTVSVANIEEGNIANVVITTNSSFTGDIMVQVANANYTVNVINGKGNISISGLKANTYTAIASLKTNGIFNDSTKNATFKVNSKPVAPAKKANVIKLTLKKVKVKKSAKKLVLRATLKINGKAPKKGTKIKFTFKGKKYTGKTNKKGVAKVTIKKKVLKKLKVGKKVKYTAKYSTKTVKRTVKVRK